MYDLYRHSIIHPRKFWFIHIPSKWEALWRVPSIFYDHDDVSLFGKRMTSRVGKVTTGCIHQTVISEFIASMVRSYLFVLNIQRSQRSIAIPTEGLSRWSLLRVTVAVIAGTRSDIIKIVSEIRRPYISLGISSHSSQCTRKCRLHKRSHEQIIY